MIDKLQEAAKPLLGALHGTMMIGSTATFD
jgi:hypothetical protein